MPTLAGTKLDKYDLLEEVGHGGMAVVYRGYDRNLQREVAVKVLHAHLANREESRLRLQREALAVAKLRHDNILEIYDYSGPDADESYIVTEFIHGPTLKEWIDDELDPRPAVAALIVHRLCRALEQAHRGNIVHRDIKPENVMIRAEDGCVKLMDFGIAQILDNQKLTLTGQLIGSPAYMAPELISGRPLDVRTDLFSLGILLYQLATGKLPFGGRNPHEVLNRIADGDYPAPSTICPLCDRELEDIIARGLATNPDERYQTAESFARELEEYLLEMGIEPNGDELATYFRDPKAYVTELDVRVAAALIALAERAAAEGQTARTIRLLGRVLDIDPEHKRARAMLDRVRVRERRVRHLLVGAGAVAAAGLVAAGVLLLDRPDPDTPRELALDPHHEVEDGEVPLLGEAEIPRVEDPDPASDSTGPEEEDPTPPDERPVRPANGRRPTRVPTAALHQCTVRFSGIPASTAKNLQVRVGGKTQSLGGTSLPIQFADSRIDVRLADGGWQAERVVTAEECQGNTIEVLVPPPPAKVRFIGGPSDLVAICRRGCAEQDVGANILAAEFPSIPVVNGTQQVVSFELKAPGFMPRTVRETVYPGRLNEIQVQLEPVPP